MSRYAVTNLKDAEDVVEAPDREIRFGRKHLDSEALGVTYERFDPDYVSTDGHRHEEQEEAYVVVSGSGSAKLDDEVVELRQWDVIRVAPEVVRGFDAGPDGLELIAIGGPKPEGGDGVPVRGRWSSDS
jgi:quercetin dioxygenase-like cupin family protein